MTQAALKCVYLALMSLDPTGTGRKRWSARWVESARSAVPALLPVRFCGPLAEPGVRAPGSPRSVPSGVVGLDEWLGIFCPRYR
jgi:hypothetical protein